jgi:hypothetical protein
LHRNLMAVIRSSLVLIQYGDESRLVVVNITRVLLG